MKAPLRAERSVLARGDKPRGGTRLVDIADRATPTLLLFWRAIRARWWLVFGSGLLLAVLTFLLVGQMTPIYRASTVVLIESANTKVVSIEEVYGGASANREYFQTQAEFLKSREVARRVVDQLSLASHPEFDGTRPSGPVDAFKRFVRQRIPLFGSTESAEPLDPASAAGHDQADQARAKAIDSLRRRLTVEPVRHSHLVEVAFESADPLLAAEVANALAHAYIQADLDARFDVTQQANVWLSARLGELRDRLEESERSLQTYRESEGIVDSKNIAMGGTSKQLEEITQRLVEARVRKSQAAQLYAQVRPGVPNRYSVPAVLNSTAVSRAKEIEAEAEKRLIEASQRYGAAHPVLQSLRKELEAAKGNTRREAEAVIASIQKDYELAQGTERALEVSLKSSRGTVSDINRKEIRLGALEREVDSNRHLYQTFLSRAKETSAAADMQTAVARIIDPAVRPREPVRPARALSTLVAAAAGLLIGMLLAQLFHRLDNTLRSSDAVEAELGVQMLAALPPLGKNVVAGMYVTAEPGSVFSEGIRTASTGVLMSMLDIRAPVVAVTSALPGEGKTTFATNFAALQSTSRRILVIDADLRRPSASKVLSAPADSVGLSDYLAGTVEIEDTLIESPMRDLWILPAGQSKIDPVVALASERLAAGIEELRDAFDLIVIDCPPLQLVSDALLVARVSSGMVLVTTSGKTPVPMLRSIIDRLSSSDASVLGIVLNRHDFDGAVRYYGDYYAPGKYGYGYEPRSDSAR